MVRRRVLRIGCGRAERARRPTRRPRRRRRAIGLASLMSLLSLLPGRSLQAQTSACQPAGSAPAAAFTASCAGLSCTFTVTSPQPSGATYAWDFGDATATAQVASATMPHGYAAAGSYLVTLTVTDASGNVGIATGTVTLGSSAPLAADDAFTTTQNLPLTITIQELLANDAPGVTFVQANDSSRCYIPSGAASCTYTPASGFVGADSFTYTVRDALGNTGSATVWITVLRALVANPDYFTVPFDGSIQITSAQLLANDTPGALFVSAQDALNGTLSFVSAGPPVTYSFAPTNGFAGDASFDYFISWDGNPPYERGIVTVTVVDAPPTASFTVSCTNMTCTVHPTSYDPDSTPVSRWLWNWGDGTPTIEPGGPVFWADQTHTYAASGRYTITHTVYDTAGLSGSLQLSVVANITPVAVNDSATTERDLPVIIDLLANDSDQDGDPLTFANVSLAAYPGASYQTVQLANGRYAIKIFPPDGFVGTMTFTYNACDNWGACSAPATVTLTVVQTSIIVDALGDQFYCAQNGSLSIPRATLLANDYDSQGQPLTIVGFDTSILMGTLDCTTSTTVCTYKPPLNGAGYTVFTYTVADPIGRQDTTAVKIYVGYPDQAPAATEVFFTTTWSTSKTFTIQDMYQQVVDQDGDTLTFSLAGGPAYGVVTCSTPMYTCTYTPNPGYAGTDRFLYSATDMIHPAVTAGINVLTLPSPTPTFDAREDVIVTGQNQSTFFSSGLLSNDYVPSGGPETVTALDTTGLTGSLSCSSAGCTYYPPSYFTGTTAFKYTATDGHGASDTAIVKIKVGVTNNPPVAVPQTLSTPKNTALRFSVFDLMHNDYDPDNDPLTVWVYTGTAHLGSLSCGNPNYWCVYTPNANATGADAITYALSDGQASVTSTVTINITP
jgi:PKD repeat protein